jgi:hypothetical protein
MGGKIALVGSPALIIVIGMALLVTMLVMWNA